MSTVESKLGYVEYLRFVSLNPSPLWWCRGGGGGGGGGGSGGGGSSVGVCVRSDGGVIAYREG